MQVSIFGLGYVGAVTAACLADKGHGVIGADVQQAKVDAFNAGESPIVEPGLDALMQAARQGGRLRATTDVAEAVSESEVSIVCVGTPSLESGRLNLDFVRKVSQQLVDAVKEKDGAHTIIFRSTMLPGSTRTMVHDFFQPLLDAGLVTIYYCPEFLREGTAVRDFREPSLCVVGTHDGGPPTGTEPFELLGENARSSHGKGRRPSSTPATTSTRSRWGLPMRLAASASTWPWTVPASWMWSAGMRS
ncbi:hypothetical protein [Verrucomicrobium spinosum]|uniref:hypothetical protein n=1 Tax=Verrucomicrobium spinosum TaxID=2736 RepID=UPI000A7AF35F|nr:hypothetical protein [Verrucomicrobium spinosum]